MFQLFGKAQQSEPPQNKQPTKPGPGKQKLLPEEQLILKLGSLQAENQKLQELVNQQKMNKKKYKKIAQEQCNSNCKYFHETEIQELKDEIVVYRRNLDIIQEMLVNTTQQTQQGLIQSYELQIKQMKSDLKEACQYNLVLVNEVEKLSLGSNIAVSENSNTSTKSNNKQQEWQLDTLQSRNEELEQQLSFLKEQLQKKEKEDQIEPISSSFSNDLHDRKSNQNKTNRRIKEAENQIQRLIDKLREKDQAIIDLLGNEKRLSEQIIELKNMGAMKLNSSQISKTAFAKKNQIQRPDQSVVKERFDQIVKQQNSVNGSQIQGKSEDQQSVKSSTNQQNRFMELLKEQLMEKDKFIGYLQNEAQKELEIQIEELQQESKVLKQQLEDKQKLIQENSKKIKNLEEHTVNIEELNAWRTRALDFQKQLEAEKLKTQDESVILKNKYLNESSKWSQEIDNKQKKINELQDNVNDKLEIIKNLNKQVQQACVDIKLLNDKCNELDSLQQLIKQYEQTIMDLKAEIIENKQKNLANGQYHFQNNQKKIFELAQISLLPQLLPKKIQELEKQKEVGFKFIEKIQDQEKQHVKFTLLVKVNSFYMQFQQNEITEIIYSYYIQSVKFDAQTLQFGVLNIIYKQNSEEKTVDFTGLEVAQLYSLLCQLFQKMDKN